MKRVTILVVDDDVLIRDLLASSLTKQGYLVLMAPDGHIARDIVVKAVRPIDVAVIDLMLPDLDGAETLKCITSVSPNTRCLLSSGMEQMDTCACARFGADGYLRKPYRIEALIEAIENAMALREENS